MKIKTILIFYTPLHAIHINIHMNEDKKNITLPTQSSKKRSRQFLQTYLFYLGYFAFMCILIKKLGFKRREIHPKTIVIHISMYYSSDCENDILTMYNPSFRIIKSFYISPYKNPLSALLFKYSNLTFYLPIIDIIISSKATLYSNIRTSVCLSVCLSVRQI